MLHAHPLIPHNIQYQYHEPAKPRLYTHPSILSFIHVKTKTKIKTAPILQFVLPQTNKQSNRRSATATATATRIYIPVHKERKKVQLAKSHLEPSIPSPTRKKKKRKK